MLEFITQEVKAPFGTIEAACFVSNPDDCDESDEGIVKDDALIPLPGQLIGAIAESIARCDNLEKNGSGVDCGVFGVMVAGGTYRPVSNDVYRSGLHRRIEFGRWLDRDEILGTTTKPELVQFVALSHLILPRHVAIKLPGTEGDYIQKIGNGMPIAICDAMANLRFHGAHTATSTNKFSATYRGQLVLSYEATRPASSSVGIYRGVPG